MDYTQSDDLPSKIRNGRDSKKKCSRKHWELLQNRKEKDCELLQGWRSWSKTERSNQKNGRWLQARAKGMNDKIRTQNRHQGARNNLKVFKLNMKWTK